MDYDSIIISPKVIIITMMVGAILGWLTAPFGFIPK